ncbi:hypothetical protein FGO68_gene16571 [Halteria grandinella]|uniref:Leucine Rich Repeat family protein n=1 Tax=Halteria grandinella TaxID=5974 RepID=A0A8J8T725_HALGN|nr:hypothetical protein FGO68_gene16571 [Halteria grandinella]
MSIQKQNERDQGGAGKETEDNTYSTPHSIYNQTSSNKKRKRIQSAAKSSIRMNQDILRDFQSQIASHEVIASDRNGNYSFSLILYLEYPQLRPSVIINNQQIILNMNTSAPQNMSRVIKSSHQRNRSMGNLHQRLKSSATVRRDKERLYSSLENTQGHNVVTTGNVSLRPQTAVMPVAPISEQYKSKSSGRVTYMVKESQSQTRNKINDSMSAISYNRRTQQMSNLMEMLSQQCHSTRKTSSLVRIDTKNMDKEQCLSETEVMRVFQARNTDLQLGQFFDQQFMRFREYCTKKCINRKVIFDDVRNKLYLKNLQLWMGLNSAIEIAQILVVNQRIASLSLKRNNLGDIGVKMIMKAISRSNSLVHLDLSSNAITHKGAKKIFKALMVNQSLISLSLGSTDNVQKNKVGEKGIKYLVPLLQYSQHLEFLNLSGNLLQDTGVIELCEGIIGNRTLVSLNIAKNELTGFSILKLRDTLKTASLRELNLSLNPLGSQAIKDFAQFLSSHECTTMEKVDISDCKCTWEGAFVLMNSVKCLKELILDKNDLRTRARSTPQLTTLVGKVERLSMQMCNISDDMGVSIANGLIGTSTTLKEQRTFNFQGIKYLNLHSNQISDESAQAFAEQLSRHGLYLVHLDLSHNKINDAGGEYLAECLSQNHTLQSLNLKRNNLKETTAPLLFKHIQLNKSLRYINLERNELPPTIVEQIYLHLQKNTLTAVQNEMPRLKTDLVHLQKQNLTVEINKVENEYLKRDEREKQIQRGYDEDLQYEYELTESLQDTYNQQANIMKGLDAKLEQLTKGMNSLSSIQRSTQLIANKKKLLEQEKEEVENENEALSSEIQGIKANYSELDDSLYWHRSEASMWNQRVNQSEAQYRQRLLEYRKTLIESRKF